MCTSPLLAVRLFKPELGKNVLSFKAVHPEDNLKTLYFKFGRDNVYELPCGQCDECRHAYSRNWAYRLTLERKYWKNAYFITLTYDDLHNPFNVASSHVLTDQSSDEELLKDIANNFYNDFKNFIKRCRYHLGDVAFFGASELGSVTQRLHYHVVLFTNKEIDLLNPRKMNGHLHYDSQFIKDNWKFGHIHDVAPFEHYCGGYIAKYTTKDKVKVFMSRNLGKRYFYEHYQEIIDNGFIIYEKFGHEDKIYCPRFMVPWFKEIDELTLDDFLKSRNDFMSLKVNEKMRGYKVDHAELLQSQKISTYNKKRGDF